MSAGEMTGLGGLFGQEEAQQAVAENDDSAREAVLQQLPRSWFNTVVTGQQDPVSAVERYERRGRSHSNTSSLSGFSLPSLPMGINARGEGQGRRLAWHGRSRALAAKLVAFGAFVELRRELGAQRALSQALDVREGGGGTSLDENVLDVVRGFCNRLATPLTPAERLQLEAYRVVVDGLRNRHLQRVLDERRRGLDVVDGLGGWRSTEGSTDGFGEGLLPRF